MEAFSDDRQLSDRSLEPVDLEEVSGCKDRDAVASAIPRVAVLGQVVEGTQNGRTLPAGIFPPQRQFQLFDEVAKPDWILLLVRVRTMGRLMQRKTWWFVTYQQHRSVIALECVHGRSPQ